MKKFVTGLFALAVMLGGGAVYFHFDAAKGAADAPHYVTSETCQSCHEAHYDSWHDTTLHPKMFHPVPGPNEIVGDFESDDPALTFIKADVEFVIGNKWEQVYARMIDGEYYPLTAKWMITTNKWVPYKVDDWKQTPLSEQCNGCHTTGFNADTYEFSEFGIGCEACHGPGSAHVANRRAVTDTVCLTCHEDDGVWEEDIINSVNSAVCGQCHTRGNQTVDNEHMQTTFRFPLNVKPGDALGEDFVPVTVETDKKGKHWWGLGVSKNRHQEFADFSMSKHGRALDLMRERHTPDRGKLDDSCLKCHSADYILAKPGEEPTLETATQGLTCAVCHEPHGLNRQFPGTNISPAERCGTCHADSLTIKAAKRGQQHYPGPPSSKQCVDCHMPYIVKSGGAFPIRSHAFKIVPPVATQQLGMPNSCQNGGCHDDKSVEWAMVEFDAFYGAGRVKDAITLKECGSCHHPFDPAAQTPQRWQQIMSSLDTHFGVNATVPEDVRRHITDYLILEPK